NSRFVDRRIPHSRVQVSGREGSRGDPAQARAPFRRVHEWKGPPQVLGGESARKIQCCTGDVSVNVDSAGEDNQAARIDRTTIVAVRDNAAIGNADVLDDAIDPVSRIVDLPTRYSHFALPKSLSERHPPSLMQPRKHEDTKAKGSSCFASSRPICG